MTDRAPRELDRVLPQIDIPDLPADSGRVAV